MDGFVCSLTIRDSKKAEDVVKEREFPKVDKEEER